MTPKPALDPLTQWFASVEQIRAAWGASHSEQAPVDLVQTHISAVLLGATEVLKLKKPVDFGFLDYSTLEKRKAACEAEVRLNRRLAPQTYLGVQSIHSRDGALALGPEGPVVDYAVHMRRLPQERMLDEVVERHPGEVTEALIGEIAALLARFHAASPRTPAIEHWGEWDQIRGQWTENFEQTREFIGRSIEADTFAAIEEWISEQLDERRPLFDARVREKRIVDGHGDLRCESVCLTDPIQFFDCIEFSDRLRCCDAASEIAFLAMDLCMRGRADLGYHLTHHYAALTKDRGLAALAPFYQCYRAYVRGKVLSFRLEEPTFTEQQKRADAGRAWAFFEQARRYAAPLDAPMVVIVSGLSGTGKTSVARAIAHELGLTVHSADQVRHDLFGDEKRPAGYGQGVYSPEATQRTYSELMERASGELQQKKAAVLDATFLQPEQRGMAAGLAQEAGVPLRFIECTLPANVARARIEQRQAKVEGKHGGHSDAGWDIYERQRADYDVQRLVLPEDRLVLDTSGALGDAARTAAEWLRNTPRD